MKECHNKKCKDWKDDLDNENCHSTIYPQDCANYSHNPQTEQPEELAELQRNFQRLLNAVNKVTAAHRHGNPVTVKALDNLSNVQLEVEQAKADK